MNAIARAFVLAMSAGLLVACGSRSEPSDRRADSAQGQASRARSAHSGPTEALVAFLEASREGAPKAALPFDSLMTCQMGDGMYLPTQLLATYHVLPVVGPGDTVTISARATTVAEEDGSPTHVGRYVAVQRIKTETERWRVARTQAGEWRVCSGPQFGAYGNDTVTSWRPSTASYKSARQLADSVYRSDPPSRGGV